MADWSDLKSRVAGKWQFPLLAMSTALLVVAVFRLKFNPVELSPERAVVFLDTLVSGGLYQRAVDIGDGVLAREDISENDRAAVHLRLARARFAETEDRGFIPFDAPGRILEHYGRAEAYRIPLTGADHQRIGRTMEWGYRFVDAVAHYEQAIDQGVDAPLNLRRHIIELHRDRIVSSPETIDGMLGDFLASLDDRRLDLRLWALQERLDTLRILDRLGEATTLLARQQERFMGSDLRHQFAYLKALLLYRSGFHNEAEMLLRSVRNNVERTEGIHAKTGWLLGRVVLRDNDGPQRPQEALSFFTDVIHQHGSGPYVVASRVGEAEALALLERHSEAVRSYQLAIDDLTISSDRGPVNEEALRVSLVVLAEGLRQTKQLPEAIEYSRLAGRLVDRNNVEQATLVLQQLASLQAWYAELLETAYVEPTDQLDRDGTVMARSPAAREFFGEAATTFLDLAQLNVLNDRLAIQASWQAAELMARSGQRERAARLFRSFTTEHPGHAQVPRALLRIGQLLNASRKLPDAIDAYRECYRRFPRTIDGARALVPLARCYLAMGSDSAELAEDTLRIVLEESEVFTPLAPEFADAQFLLGDAFARRGAFEDAISVLQEAIDRYPTDSRNKRGRFLLADAYRQSGLALKREITEARFAGEIEKIRQEYAARLATARVLFGELIAEFEARDPASLSRLETIYMRHAYLYEADCHFENLEYEAALKLYEDAVGMFKELPSGLASYVQIINCHVFLGRPSEARAALARALVLVDSMPQEALDRSISPETREDWKRYFEWLGDSKLLQPLG